MLMARYDASLLRPPATPDPAAPPHAATAPHGQQALNRLLAWCRHGTGDGRAPLLRPGARPAIPLPLSVALLGGVADGAASPLVEDLALQLDSTYQLLAAGGRWPQRLFRLRVKARECRWWRPRAADAPWDCGYLIDSPTACARLPQWQPRRPTLLIAQGLADEPLRLVLRTLAARQAAFLRPVRLLVVSPVLRPALAHGLAAAEAPVALGPWSLQVL